MQQLTWLDLLAANFFGFLWIAGVIFAHREAKRSKMVFGWLIFFVLLGFGLGLVIWRAGVWYDPKPTVMVPSAGLQ